MKQEIATNIFLQFKEEENNKFSFFSEDPRLQSWINNCKKKSVKLSEIHFVVKAAKEFWNSGETPVTVVRPTVEKNFRQLLKELCDKRKLNLSYDIDEVQPGLDDGFIAVANINEEQCGEGYFGFSKKEALEFAAQEAFKILTK